MVIFVGVIGASISAFSGARTSFIFVLLLILNFVVRIIVLDVCFVNFVIFKFKIVSIKVFFSLFFGINLRNFVTICFGFFSS